MSPSRYTEDNLVQRTTAEYLAEQLGWESVYAHNHEDFGPESLLGRASEHEVVLVRTLRRALAELNPGRPEAAFDDAIRQLTATIGTQSIVVANRAMYALIRDGVPVTYRNEKNELVQDRLRVLDFERPVNNQFLCVRELWVRGDLYRRRPDIIGFVNGLPLLFIECKNVHRSLETAFKENYSDYRDTIPHVFHHNAVVLFGNGAEARIGSITSKWEHFHEWKRLAEEEPGAVDMETLLKGIGDKRNFIDLVENFILFDDSTDETRKILARNHQFLGVNRAVEAVREREARGRRLGVFWHTQGAGKSYSMVMFTRKVHRKLGGNFTFLVLTDRNDLDRQIYRTFAGCGVVDHDRDPCRASDGQHLSRLLAEHKSHVFSLIQKFNRNVEPDRGYSQRRDIVVITDEAHRTQYGILALNMRNALPNASFIGLTGTPLFKDDQITRQVFGGYISTYDFQRAVEDGATVPLYYDARGEKLGVAVGDLNERIAEKLEEFEIDGIDVEQRLQQELERDYHVVTADMRLDQVARDFVRHYSAAWETGKAMLICIDKLTNAFRTSRDAVDIVYRSLQRDREQADISDIIRALHRVVDEAIETRPDDVPAGEARPLYDISRIDFDRLRQEFDSSMQRHTVVQNLRHVVEQRLKRLLAQNPLRTDFQRHYEGIVADYNREKDRVTIERTFEDLLKFARELDEESRRAVREGLDEESLAIFDLLKKEALAPGEIESIKQIACSLLETLKAEKLRIEEWREKESTRDAVYVAIHDFLYSSDTGLPESSYGDDEVRVKAEDVFRHVYRVYPVVPSPYYEHAAAA